MAPHSDPSAGKLTPADWGLLLRLQRQGLQYFVENQRPNGLVLDRQSNHGPRRAHEVCSIAATGMGLIALALASDAPYRLLSPAAATLRVRATLDAALERLPHDHGVVPHFIHSATGEVFGSDYFSTVETAWLVAGALWAAEFLQDRGLQSLAQRLYDRIDWHYWTAAGSGLLHHGKGRDGRFLGCCWDRINGETVFMYVLGAGAADGRCLAPDCLRELQPFYGTVAGLEFNSADLGLFVFQYGLDLLDLKKWLAPSGPDLAAEARLATLANEKVCHEAADRFTTYQRYWGLSAGDGPGESSLLFDRYRCYSPSEPLDGTAHVTATLASIAHQPSAVLENVRRAQKDELRPWGRYGISNINLDQCWVSRDMVGIDVGASVMAVDNFLMHDRVRRVFHGLSCVARGLQRLGYSGPTPENESVARQAS
jgi:hypothetical protein